MSESVSVAGVGWVVVLQISALMVSPWVMVSEASSRRLIAALGVSGTGAGSIGVGSGVTGTGGVLEDLSSPPPQPKTRIVAKRISAMFLNMRAPSTDEIYEARNQRRAGRLTTHRLVVGSHLFPQGAVLYLAGDPVLRSHCKLLAVRKVYWNLTDKATGEAQAANYAEVPNRQHFARWARRESSAARQKRPTCGCLVRYVGPKNSVIKSSC